MDLELAWRVFTVLEAVDWKWTARDVIEQPEQLLDAVLGIKYQYQEMKSQNG